MDSSWACDQARESWPAAIDLQVGEHVAWIGRTETVQAEQPVTAGRFETTVTGARH